MIDLLLAVSFIAFFLALLDTVIDFASIFIGTLVANTVASISLSSLAHYLLNAPFDKKSILTIVGYAFLGRVMFKVAEKVVDHRPVIVNAARQ